MDVMYLLYILTFGWHFYGCGGVQYYIIEKETFSGDAKTSCTLASPKVDFNRDGNVVRIDNNIIKNYNNKTQAFWVGYVRAYAEFLYKGCAINVNSTVHTKMRTDPGQCFSKCQTKYIGLQETTCHCITNRPTVSQLFSGVCSLSCSPATGLLCGSSHTISVYQKVMSTPSANNAYGYCLTYSTGSNKLQWKNCLSSNYAYRMCHGDAFTNKKLESWNEAMQTCIKMRKYPDGAPSSQLKSHVQDNTKTSLWTGIIRSHIIFHPNDTYYATHYYEQGYVALDNGKVKLCFGRNGKLPSICETSGTTPTGTSQSSGSSVSHSFTEVTTDNVLSTSTTKGQTVSIPTRSTTTSTSKTDFTLGHSSDGDEGDLSEENGPNKVILYISIPATLVVIVGVLVGILWRRRSLPLCKRAEEEDEKTTSAVTTSTKLETQRGAQVPQNNYHVLEPMCLYEPMQEEGGKLEPTETDYDTATPGGLKQNEHPDESSNVYNKLDIMPTYSHIGGAVNFALKVDDTYNHIESNSADSGDNVYDSTTDVPSSDRVNKYPDDTYSKINQH